MKVDRLTFARRLGRELLNAALELLRARQSASASKGAKALAAAACTFVLSLASIAAEAQTFYVRSGASGSGSDWANAMGSLPSTLARGATYYIADGTYSSRTLDTPNSGSAVITIKKCTASDHGTNTGYNSAYCDGQAVFNGDILLGSDYWVIDGATRNESNWANGAAYGFAINGGIIASTALTNGVCASHVTVRYVSLGGADVGNSYTGGEADFAFKTAGFAESCVDWVLSRNYAHNAHTIYHINGSDQGIIEYSYIAHGFGKEAVRGQIRMSNFTIRHNIFKDSCQGNPGDPTGRACTAPIALFDGSSWVNTKIYGNVFYYTNSSSVQDGILVVGGLSDPSATGVEIYNNTFAGFREGAMQILVRGSGTCRNNLSYNMTSAPSFSCGTSSNNSNVASSVFVGAASGDYRLASSSGSGFTLSAPYNVDMVGNTRGANGIWSLGAYQLGGTVAPPAPLQAPSNLTVR